MIAKGDEKPSCVEIAQELYDSVKERGYSEELIQNAFQLMKKLEKESHELNNVADYEEEEDKEDEQEDYDSMDLDTMRKTLKEKGIIEIRVGR